MEPLLILEYSNGSLPPPYAYAYKISFFETGYAQAEFFSSENGDLKPIKSENKKYSEEDFNTIFSTLQNEPEKNRELMIGGETRKMLFKKAGQNEEIIIDPNDSAKKKVFDHFLKIYDENFEKNKNKIIENNSN